jgi:hypothetical protein
MYSICGSNITLYLKTAQDSTLKNLAVVTMEIKYIIVIFKNIMTSSPMKINSLFFIMEN